MAASTTSASPRSPDASPSHGPRRAEGPAPAAEEDSDSCLTQDAPADASELALGEVVETVRVPAKLVGPRICGPKKSKLLRLQADSGARILVPKQGAHGKDVQILSIYGSSAQVAAALNAIHELLRPSIHEPLDEACSSSHLPADGGVAVRESASPAVGAPALVGRGPEGDEAGLQGAAGLGEPV